MIVEKRTIDINAHIIDLFFTIKSDGDSKKLEISFRNLNYGVITAVRMIIKATDSFGDKVLFDDTYDYEIKRADLKIKPGNKASLSVELGQYDVKNVELKIVQIAYASGEIYDVEEPEYVDYEIEKFSRNWSNNDRFDHDALEIIKEYNSEAICIPAIHTMGWICSCGYLNLEGSDKCRRCEKDKYIQFNKYTKEELEKELNKREQRKKEEEEEQERLRKIAEDSKAKKQRAITIGISSAAAVLIAVVIAFVLYNNHKYGMTKEDVAMYKIAQDNYDKIEYFSLSLGNDFYDVCHGYYIDDYNSHRNRLSEAEKDKDYLYSRGMYEASALLFELITDQYPEKYRGTFKKLAKAHEGDVFNDIGTCETLYVMMSVSSTYIDRREGIDKAIDKLEEYMEKTVFNPDKVKYTAPSMPGIDYSNVYGISLGIMLYDDGNIMYIGEITDNQANGYGRAYYPSDEGGGLMCEGTFEEGIFVDGTDYSSEKEKTMDIDEQVFSGECMMISGIENSESSEEVANKRASDEANDRRKASACAQQYAQTVANKQNGCKQVEWIDIPDISGSYYSYSCTLTMSDGSTRKGTITVEKNSDGSFSAVGMDLD